jgi:hypothetical protein
MEQVLSDGQTCKAKIIESLSCASKNIIVAMAFFTDRDIANELVKSSDKGVDVSLILADDDNNKVVKGLLSNKVKLYTHKGNGRGMMHHKFCVVDNSLLLHGSYNYTYNAAKNNEENLNITDSYNLVSQYSTIFDDLLKNSHQQDNTNFAQPNFKTTDEEDYLDKFADQLKNHISQIFDEFNHNEVVEQGRKLSEESGGQENVFLSYLDSTLERTNRKLNQDDQTRTIVKTKMAASFDKAVDANSKNLESDINLLASHYQNQKCQAKSQIETERERKKLKQNELDQENAALTKTNSAISELKDEIDSLDRQMVVKKFWTFPTVLKLLLLTLIFLYLSLFFGSAIWKIFFEEAEIMKLLSKGITPEAQPLFDANALFKLYQKKGVFFGTIATLFFLFPVLLSSIKLFNRNNKIIEVIFGWIIAIFVIDVVVSILISQHTFEIKSLVTGSSDQWTLSIALKSGEFWLIFIFGSLPLFLTKLLIETVWHAYENSNPESVDRERFLMRKSLNRKLSEKEPEAIICKTKISSLAAEFEDFVKRIIQLEDESNNLETVENTKRFELQERSERKNKNLRDIYNSFISSVDSGNKLFLHNAVNGRITTFKQGFFLHLTSYFHSNIAAKKIGSLEEAHKTWIKNNFE